MDLSEDIVLNPRGFSLFTSLAALFAFLLLIIETSGYLAHYAGLIRSLNIFCFSVFAFDVFLRFWHSSNRPAYFIRHYQDLIIFVAPLTFIGNHDGNSFTLIFRQAVIIVVLFSRIRRVKDLIALISKKPAHLMVASFLFAIGAGAVLLMLPIATSSGVKTSFVDALFTATSAVCVTGLTVKDTATHFNLFGQSVILFLIQIGGLGIMTASVSLVLLLQKRMEKQGQIMMQDVLDQDSLSSVKGTLVFILKMTVFIEAMGAIFLFFFWKDHFPGFFAAAYHSLFHAISAFCNAGFSTFSNNLVDFSFDIGVNLTICVLIVSGGLGFTVVRDIQYNLGLGKSEAPRFLRLKAQTKMVLFVSLILIVAGTALIYLLETKNSFAGLDRGQKVIVSFFQSITARTAGFNTCDIGCLSPATLLVICALMFIGGSPGSTAGGLKTTTVAVLWATLASELRQKDEPELFKRTIPAEVIKKALTLLLLSLGVLLFCDILLMYTEKKPFLDILFESVSALGTVGLSTGITGQLSEKGKVIVTVLMFLGRLGPVTVAYVFLRYRRPAQYLYAQERVMIG